MRREPMADIVQGEPGILDRVLAVLREGAWLDRSRLRVYPWILLGAYLLAAALYIGTSHGLIDSNGKPLRSRFRRCLCCIADGAGGSLGRDL
jgi:hypothetical protein